MNNYQVKTDDVLTCMTEDHHGKCLVPCEDILYIGKPTDRDLLEDEESYQPEILQATEQEQTDWSEKFEKFSVGMESAQQDVQRLMDEMDRRMDLIRKAAQEARAAYMPVHEEIQRRINLVQEARDQDEEDRSRIAQEAVDAALAAEDARLGPRLFYVTRPVQRAQDVSTLDVPTVHHRDCGTARRLKALPELVRIDDAFEALMEGGRPTYKGWRWEIDTKATRRLPGIACERCQAFDLLKAHAPATFMDWLERTESSQFAPMPKSTYKGQQVLFKKLGLPQAQRHNHQEGWTVVSDNLYREPNAMDDDEKLIGWMGVREGVEGAKLSVSSAPDRLKKLFETLPPRGFKVRWIHEPQTYGGDVCQQAVAIRPMSKWEIRQYKEQA